MIVSETRRAGLIVLAFFLLLVAFVVAIKMVYVAGDGRNLSDSITFDNVQDQSSITGGRAHLGYSHVMHWRFAEPIAQPATIKVTIDCLWIGQLFVGVEGGQEIYVTHGELSEYIRKKPVKLQLVFDNGNLTLVKAGDNGIGRSVPVGQSTIDGFVMRSSQSDLFVNSLVLRNGVGGSVIEKENFGTDFRVGAIFLRAVLLWLVFIALMLADAWLAKVLFKVRFGESFTTFLAAVLPVVVCYLLLSPADYENSDERLILAIIPVRLFLLYVFERREFRKKSDLFEYVAVALAGLAFLFYFGESTENIPQISSQPWRTVSYVGLLAVYGLITLTAWALRIDQSFRVLLALGAIFGYGFMGYIVLGYLDDDGAFEEIMSSLLAGWFVYLLVIARRYKDRIRGYSVISLVLVLMFAGSVEFALRQMPYRNRLLAADVGKDFKPENSLFWVPRDLFVQNPQAGNTTEIDIRAINFRSGPVVMPKQPNTYRILCLGGSNTWGQWVDDYNDVWTARLERLLNQAEPSRHYEVVNAGVKGYNLFQLLVLYKLYAAKYDFDMIVLYINFNDAAASRKKGMFTFRELFELRNAGKWDLVEKVIETRRKKTNPSLGFPAWVVAAQKWMQKSYAYNGLTNALVSMRSKDDGSSRIDLGVLKSVNPVSDYEENLMDFVKLSDENNIRLVFVDEFVYGEGPDDDKNEFRHAMKRIADRTGTPMFAAHHFLASHYDRDKIVFPFDTVHLNLEGQVALSSALSDFLLSQVLHSKNP